MKTILLGWDLGEGFSYVLQLRQIADALAAAGHRPVLALRSLEAVGDLLADRPHPVVQAPWLIGRVHGEAAVQGLYPTGFADLMAVNGFSSVDHLLSMQRGWRDLIDVVRPDLVVARYAPVLMSAAYGRVPTVLFGDPYVVPPADAAQFPVFSDDVPPYADQAALLDIVREVQARYGAPQPERLTDIYRGDRRVVLGLPACDPYRADRREPCVGMFETAPPLPDAPGEGVHAYLAGSDAETWLLLEALVEAGLPTRVFVRDTVPELIAAIDASPLARLDQPPPVFEACAGARLVVHHGGPNTAYAALASGRPQLVLPRELDQWLTARGMAESGDGVLVSMEAGVGAVAEQIRRLATAPEAQAAARASAVAMRAQRLHGAWQAVVDACLALV
ncbi:MAG: hypothetical protein KDH20_00405 [Rhodocyclaceae bacterium]|nr:hypothetical protein [Rhodocyclaceae bacterium]